MEVPIHPVLRPRRSLLSVPADNRRALEKAPTLPCDGVIYDLEDSVSLQNKGQARDNLAAAFADNPASSQERIIRINPLTSAFGTADMELVVRLRPDAVLVPKVEQAANLVAVSKLLAQASPMRPIALWAMIETPKGVLNAAAIAAGEASPECFVVGLNDLRKETGVPAQKGRTYLVPWLMQVVLAGRGFGVDVIDSVFNDFRDEDGFDADCAQGRAMGFSGKMLIHPAQIEPANRHFGPDESAVSEARAIVAAFDAPEAEGKNVIDIDGKMVERLHLVEAEALLAKVAFITERKIQP